MDRLNRYLLKQAIISIGGLIVFACAVLLLERMLRIFQVVSTSTNPAGDATGMITNLLPHYLGMAVPMALLLGVLLTIDRFSKTSELTAAMGAGISLLHMTKPFVIIAFLLAGATLFIEGYLQPVGRYKYRQIEHSVVNQSYAAILREGTFTNVGRRTFFAGTERPGSAIGPIFIYEKLEEGGAFGGLRLTTANEGQLIIREEKGEPVLQLSSGRTNHIFADRQLSGELTFESSAVAGTPSDDEFRIRGKDERELTSVELIKNINGEAFDKVPVSVNNAALHLRLGRAALLLILPFIAVPFGLNYGRNPSSAGIFIGIVMLVSLQKALEFGQSLGAAGKIAPWMGIWPTVGTLALFAFFLFRKSAYKMGQPPLSSFSHYLTHITDEIKAGYKSLQTAIAGER